ncbi:transporter [Catellatospora sp. TT07R-123]|nr:transporter [Catellatospora sp. TT07R-123]
MYFTWRQFRVQAAATLGFVAAVAVALAATGARVRDAFAASGLAACTDTCERAQTQFAAAINGFQPALAVFYAAIVALYLLPALIGMFWGAPLVARELEARTLRVVWSQGITRMRWTAAKLLMLGLAAAGTAALLSLAVSWWSQPLDLASALPGHDQGLSLPNRFAPLVFGARGVAPVGYALFAFLLGTTVGVLARRTIAAMAVTAAVLLGVQLLIPAMIRADYAPPAHSVVELQLEPSMPQNLHLDQGMLLVSSPVDVGGGWLLDVATVDAGGHAGAVPAPDVCVSATASLAECDQAINRLGLRQQVEYQPAGRFWRFQYTELAVYLLLAAAVGAVGVLRIRRIDLT